MFEIQFQFDETSCISTKKKIIYPLLMVIRCIYITLAVIQSQYFFYHFSEDQVRSERKTTAIKEIRESYLILIQNMADFVNAVSWLPPGLILWSGKLSRFQNGIFGMISSLIMLYRAWPEKEKNS